MLHTQLQLLSVDMRNMVYVDLVRQQLEIRQDQSGQPYQMQSDFILMRQS